MLKARFALADQSKTSILFLAGKKTEELKSTIQSLGTGNFSEEKKMYTEDQQHTEASKKIEYILIIQKPSLPTINLQWNAWKTTQQTFSFDSAFLPFWWHCSDALVKNGVSPLPFAQRVHVLLRLLLITVAGSISCPCHSFFNCRISPWALYSPRLFSYETTRSRNHDNWGQNWRSFCWTTRWSLALSYWMESSPGELSFSGSGKRGCTALQCHYLANHTNRPCPIPVRKAEMSSFPLSSVPFLF